MTYITHKTIEGLFFERAKALSFGDTCRLVSRIMEEKL